jgi:hypothetical protein
MKNFTEKENELIIACMTLANAEIPEDNFELMVLKDTAQHYIDNLEYIGVEVVVNGEIKVDVRTKDFVSIETILASYHDMFSTANKIEITIMDLLTGEVYASYNTEIYNGGICEHLYRSDEYIDNIERGE